MRKKIVVIFFCFCAIGLYATEPDSVRMAHLTAPAEKPFKIEHNIQIGVGDVLATNIFEGKPFAGIFDEYTHKNLFAPEIYHDEVMATGVISASYLCRVKKWLWFGASFTYKGYTTHNFDRATEKKVQNLNEHWIALLPSVRFSYINRKYFTLYSELLLGGGVISREKIDMQTPFPHPIERDNRAYFTFHASVLGVAVGYKVHAFLELGYGEKGYFHGGIAYRF